MNNVAVIGIDGCGKSTQAAMLVSAINRNTDDSALLVKGRHTNYEVFETIRGTITEDIPQYTRLVGYSLDLAYTFMQLEQRHDDSRIYVWDRYTHCLEAQFAPLDLDFSGIQSIVSIVKRADITLHLDIEPELAVERINQRGGRRRPLENKDYLSKVRDHYVRIASDSGAIVIDASKTQAEVHQEIWEKYRFSYPKLRTEAN